MADYEKQTWVDNTTPVDAEHLSHMEDGIAANNEALDSKADQTEIDDLKEEVEQINADLTDNYATIDFQSNAKELGENSDLNDYVDAGNYVCTSNVIAQTFSNSPTQRAFIMNTIRVTGNYRIQIMLAYDLSGIYLRYGNNGTWNSWRSVSSTVVSTSSVGEPEILED